MNTSTLDRLAYEFENDPYHPAQAGMVCGCWLEGHLGRVPATCTLEPGDAYATIETCAATALESDPVISVRVHRAMAETRCTEHGCAAEFWYS